MLNWLLSVHGTRNTALVPRGLRDLHFAAKRPLLAVMENLGSGSSFAFTQGSDSRQ